MAENGQKKITWNLWTIWTKTHQNYRVHASNDKKKETENIWIISMRCFKNKDPEIGTNAFASQDTKFSLRQYKSLWFC